jgi:hypothetical protein
MTTRFNDATRVQDFDAKLARRLQDYQIRIYSDGDAVNVLDRETGKQLRLPYSMERVVEVIRGVIGDHKGPGIGEKMAQVMSALSSMTH